MAPWTRPYLIWVAQLRFTQMAQEATRQDYLHEVEHMRERVARLAFRARLDRTLDHLSLPSGALLEIHAQQSRLAGLQPPASLDASTRTAIADLTRQGFVSGFRIVKVICAGLSLASALAALIMVPRAGESKARPCDSNPL